MSAFANKIAKKCKIQIWGAQSKIPFEITASTPIEQTNVISYGATNLIDRDINTAWCTNRGKGAPLWINIKYPQPKHLTGLGFVNGYTKNAATYKNNARPSDIVVYVDDRIIAKVKLKDTSEPQWIEFQPVTGINYKFVVENIYEGLKYDDVCVAEMFDDKRVIDGYNLIKTTDKKFAKQALTSVQIKRNMKPLYDSLFSPEHKDETSFWDTVSIRVSSLDERGLRLLLDLSSYADEMYKGDINAQLYEGLLYMILPYIEQNQDAIISVIKDEGQVKRENLGYAYNAYGELYGYNSDKLKALSTYADNFMKRFEEPKVWHPVRIPQDMPFK